MKTRGDHKTRRQLEIEHRDDILTHSRGPMDSSSSLLLLDESKEAIRLEGGSSTLLTSWIGALA